MGTYGDCSEDCKTERERNEDYIRCGVGALRDVHACSAPEEIQQQIAWI